MEGIVSYAKDPTDAIRVPTEAVGGCTVTRFDKDGWYRCWRTEPHTEGHLWLWAGPGEGDDDDA